MKKFFGFIFHFLAFVLMTVAMTLVTVELLVAVEPLIEATWLIKAFKTLFSNPWLTYGVTAGVWVLLLIVGSAINAKIAKRTKGFAGVLTFLFGLGAYGAALYFVMWGALRTDHVFLSEFGWKIAWLTRDIALYGGAGAMALACVLSVLARAMRSPKKQQKSRSQVQVQQVPDTDLAYTSSRDQRKEVYVRDPWGNFIRQEEYDERINRSRSQKF